MDFELHKKIDIIMTKLDKIQAEKQSCITDISFSENSIRSNPDIISKRPQLGTKSSSPLSIRKKRVMINSYNSDNSYNSNRSDNSNYSDNDILIVDDSDVNLKLTNRIMLSWPGVNNILTAMDGFDAIAKMCYNMNTINIVIMDNVMPNMNGIKATKILRDMGFNKLIIGVTGNILISDIVEFKSSGVDYIYTKPFSKEKMDQLAVFVDKYGCDRKEKKTIEMVDEKLEWVDIDIV